MVEINITVDLHGVDTQLKQKADQLDMKISQFMNKLAYMAQRMIQREAPRKTGRLKSSVDIRGDLHRKTVFLNKNVAPYCDWVIDGRPGFTAKNARALRFRGNDGKWIFRKRVGPSKKNPFIDNAVPAIESQAQVYVNQLQEWITS